MDFSEKHLFHPQRCRCWYKRFTCSIIIGNIFTIILTSVVVKDGITIINIIEGISLPQF